ncbi:polyribonucleotide 5'-hydroxyl-kinase [Enteropsectra breve]|nr:polyribonucleotide 5'-hydroxyl-kinase [Enteropsectra breve]
MEIILEPCQEYKLEIGEKQHVKIIVLKGEAEIRGQELLNEKWYTFSNIKMAIFSLSGAVIKIDGEVDLHYKPRSSFFHRVAEYFDRNLAMARGPKNIMVIGNGRATFAASIVNYNARLHRKSIFTDIDPSSTNIFPGTLSTMLIDTFVDHTTGFQVQNPFCMFYGSTSLENYELYTMQIEELAKYIAEKSESSTHIVCAPALSNEQLAGIAKLLDIHEVVYLGNERTYNMLKTVLPTTFIENSGYVTENTETKCIRKYFYGAEDEYTPCSFTIKEACEVLQVGEDYVAPSTALPLGAERKIAKTGIRRTQMMENHILAISEAKNEKEIATAPVSGFLVCIEESKNRVLCAQPKLPKSCFIVSSNIKYTDF